jgi:hypothetical protein
MTDETETRLLTVALTMTELQLVLTSLRFLLAAEDDPAVIDRLKHLIPRLEDR